MIKGFQFNRRVLDMDEYIDEDFFMELGLSRVDKVDKSRIVASSLYNYEHRISELFHFYIYKPISTESFEQEIRKIDSLYCILEIFQEACPGMVRLVSVDQTFYLIFRRDEVDSVGDRIFLDLIDEFIRFIAFHTMAINNFIEDRPKVVELTRKYYNLYVKEL